MPKTLCRTAVILLALAATGGGAFAQAQGAGNRTAAASPAPLDLRMGAVQSPENGDRLTDGGLRTAGSTPAMSVAVPLGKDYRVGPNDLIDIEVLDAENLKRTVRVNGAGYVSLPLIGHVFVAGKTPQEVEQKLAELYGEKYLQNPQVSIFIKEFTADRITIEGAVSRPGIYPVTGQLTLLRVLAVAGGFGSIANTSKVMVYRTNNDQKREVSVFDVEKIRAGEAEDPRIYGDDLIVVQRDTTRALLKDSLLRDVLDSINPFSALVPR